MIVRRFRGCGYAALGFLLLRTLLAAPPLTTIQDVLYRADGTLFKGVAFIEWKGFEASDQSNIATHSLSVPINNGVLRVQLVPSTTAVPESRYVVRYNSDGKIQFEETWAVPPSATPLRVRDVRVAESAPIVNPPPLEGPIQQSDVVGLTAELAARPVKGPGYGASRVAFINEAGQLEAVLGASDDCVRVDGTTGPCGTDGAGGGGISSGAVFVDGETPAGLINGSNVVFTLQDSPVPGSGLSLYRNGLLQKQGLDYSISGNVITFVAGAVPQPGDVLTVSYRLPGAGPAAHDLLSVGHGDTTPGGATRGDLIVAAGTAPTTWKRLPLGPANRCLMSNGEDAVWNTCLFTNFAAGSVPFVDANGNLEQNSSALVWDNANRRLSLGNSVSQATLYLYDELAETGSTELAIRAGAGQGSKPLQSWFDAAGAEVARVDAAGGFAGASFRGRSSDTVAAWQDVGTSTDPVSPTNGDMWFNTTANARKSMEGGQSHALPQVLCSSTGGATSTTNLASLGSCTIPAGFLKPGDRVEIRFDYSHQGGDTAFEIEVRWGATAIANRNAGAGETLISGRADASIRTAGAQVSSQSWGTALTLTAAAGIANDSAEAPVMIDFLGRMDGVTAETIALEGFTVVRYPAQANP